MATPTPGKQPQVVATPPVSTPFSTSNHHPAFSPHGPRSVVLSPQQVKKSPANSNTVYGYPSGGGHPTNSSFGVGYDSPSAAMALGGASGLADLGLDGIAGTGIGGLGSIGGRGDEDERKRKLQQVMEILQNNKGRLSEAGIERLARRMGLECLWETHMGSGGSMRTLIIAGSALALDIDFSNNVVKKVALSFPESTEFVTKHTEKAGDILLRDLQLGPNESPLTKMLDRFAANLERLAALDKLSIIPGLNCHEAIAGIYESLERLHIWEAERLREQADMEGKDTAYIERTAMCTKSGKPAMHTRDRLGLSIDYWQSKRRVTPTSTKTTERTWSLLVECAPLPALVFPPLRVSQNWISPSIQKAASEVDEIFSQGPILDWLEPDNMLLPSVKPDAMEDIDQSSTQKVPEAMFVAKYDPPLIVPMGLAMQIYSSTNANSHLDVYQTTTFDGLMFPHSPNESIEPTEARTIETESTVPVFDSKGVKSTQTHRNTLLIEKIDYGRKLTDLPFSHPRQLVEMLPALRQYAFLSTVLGKTFGADSKLITKDPNINPTMSKKAAFADFMSQPPVRKHEAFKMDVTLTTQPLLRLRVVFPCRKETADVTFDIKLNGVVEVVSQNLLDEDAESGRKGLIAADLGRMLEITEDLGIWAEYIRRRLG
ncbi:Uncharacterized protein BP5553_03408 [Venustampulla echinocandica]|uniref:Mediator of RNA polymerase II transcription subunit 1 n=1 Tax=Venustampulla echinocandica TaxID=2656787 RepID=A0A370TUA1_9HELO|nr:Uncharacterized protein BP5553_03408 [Venustampulla echinocandica]RDL39068.1 Uncharacterized protein BP5553_03408 [Venustampulla echinocandica]